MPIDLWPNPRIRLRWFLFAGLAALGLIGTAAWWNKAIWLAGMAFFCGTYRIARLHAGQFERRMVYLFVPRPWKSWPLDRFVEIEILYVAPFSVGRVLPLALINPCFIVWFRLFDWLIPWFGGSYKLRLKPQKGPRVVVWQGNSEANYHANLELLQSVTGLRSRRRS